MNFQLKWKKSRGIIRYEGCFCHYFIYVINKMVATGNHLLKIKCVGSNTDKLAI
jgi:hypothetical protein